MAKPKAYVVTGLGIGCHEEVAHAFEIAGADAEFIHIKELLSGSKNLFKSQILNFPGGFLHGDILGAGMCAANEIEHSVISGDSKKRFKDILVDYSEKGNVIYGQCNGFQLLVKTGLLPGIGNDYSKQTVTLTNNNCGNYWVAPVYHNVEGEHFAFKGIVNPLLWCRHGEGKIQFYSKFGLVTKKEGEKNRREVNKNHVLLRYVHSDNILESTEDSFIQNGSVDGIAGLVNFNGNIFGHMGHPEVSVYSSRSPDYYFFKDLDKRGDCEQKLINIMPDGLRIFMNIVDHLK